MGAESNVETATHCGARTRSNGACRNRPVRRRPRWRLHGGAPGSGAPRGNRNAVTHGCTTAAVRAERRAVARLIRESRRTLAEMGGTASLAVDS